MFPPSLHQDLHHKLNKRYSNYTPIYIITIILNEKDINLVIEEIVNDTDFKKSDTEIETYHSIEEIEYPQKFEAGALNNPDELNEKEMNDPRVQAISKLYRHDNLSIFIISQAYCDLPKRSIIARENFYHIFKPNNYRDV